jgi:hypothetical protein
MEARVHHTLQEVPGLDQRNHKAGLPAVDFSAEQGISQSILLNFQKF